MKEELNPISVGGIRIPMFEMHMKRSFIKAGEIMQAFYQQKFYAIIEINKL